MAKKRAAKKKKTRTTKTTASKKRTAKKRTTKKRVTKKRASTTGKTAGKKTARRTTSKKRPATKRTTTKRSSKKKVTRSARKKTASRTTGGPFPVDTGRGATPAEIGADIVAMIRAGRADAEIWDKWFHDGFESVEGSGQSWVGRKAVAEKVAQWEAENTVRELTVEGPYVGATHFAIRYLSDIENAATGERMKLTEIGVYEVRDGKVVREEFMYGMNA